MVMMAGDDGVMPIKKAGVPRFFVSNHCLSQIR